MFTKHSRGTASYRAPELTAEVSTFSRKVDIWGLGCILYELAVKRKAFTDDWAVRQYAERKQRLDVPLEYFARETQILLKDLIQQMLQVNPAARPSAQELNGTFTRLLKAPPIAPPIHTLENESALFSKGRRPLPDDVEPNTDQQTV